MKYAKAGSLADALSRLADGAVVLAGGTVLVPEMMSAGAGPSLVDIGGLAGLRGIRRDGSALVIGALVTLAELSAGVPELPALQAAASQVANPHVRLVATVGGNVAFRLPYPNLPPVLMALAAEVVLAGSGGDEVVSIDRIALDGVPRDRLITAVRVPLDRPRHAGFRKYAWRHSSGRTLVSVGVGLEVSGRGAADPRLAVGGICQHPRRLPRTEARLVGRPLDADAIEEAARMAAEEVVADVDAPPSASYRRRLVAAGVRAALADVLAS
jgi:CO/xanthine dehydrogenase FAD-binding subunit